jgi:hypothetical protein
MRFKDSSESRIRGWFPQEPCLNKGDQKTKLIVPKTPPTIQERLVGGLGAAGGTLIISGIIFSFVPSYPQTLAIAVLITGIPLLITAFLIRWTYSKKR